MSEDAKAVYPEMYEKKTPSLTIGPYTGGEFDTIQISDYDPFTNKRKGTPYTLTYNKISMTIIDKIVGGLNTVYGPVFGEFRDFVNQLHEQGAVSRDTSRILTDLTEKASKVHGQEEKDKFFEEAKEALQGLRRGDKQG